MSIYDNDIVNVKDIKFSDRPIEVTPICPNPGEHKIIERLKKELKNYQSIEHTGDHCYDEGTKEVIDVLQKILGEEK